MNATDIQSISTTPPPHISKGWKFPTAKSAHDEINRLEKTLGFTPTATIFNVAKANARIRELQSMVSDRTETTSAPPVTVSSAITFEEWRAMSAADQLSFARDGGLMQREEFLEKMPAQAQRFFLANGGHLENVAEVTKSTQPPKAGTMHRDDFLALSPKEQTAFFAAGKKVVGFSDEQ